MKQDHDSEAAENWITSVWPKIQNDYSASTIYNCDVTGLYFRALPEGILCFKNEKLSGSKKSKEHFANCKHGWITQATAICHWKIC